jgi:hypothetical protein
MKRPTGGGLRFDIHFPAETPGRNRSSRRTCPQRRVRLQLSDSVPANEPREQPPSPTDGTARASLQVDADRRRDRRLQAHLWTAQAPSHVQQSAFRRGRMPSAFDGGCPKMPEPLTKRLDCAKRHPVRIAAISPLLVMGDLGHQQTEENIDLREIFIVHARGQPMWFGRRCASCRRPRRSGK